MLLTTTTAIAFVLVAVLALGVGIFSKRNEVYMLGIVLLLFMGLWILQSGFSESIGGVLVDDGNSTTTVTETFETSNTVWSNGFGLLLIVTAAGLGLHFYRAGKDEKQRKHDSIDVED